MSIVLERCGRECDRRVVPKIAVCGNRSAVSDIKGSKEVIVVSFFCKQIKNYQSIFSSVRGECSAPA